MYETKVLEYLLATWNAVANMATVIPGGLSQERKVNIGVTNGPPYALVRITPESIPYLSDQNRHSIYTILIEVYSDNSLIADLEAIDTKLEAFLIALTPGATIGIGKLIYGWRVVPGGEGLLTEADRRAGNDVIAQRLGIKLRVQWY